MRCFRLPIVSLFFFLVASPVFAEVSISFSNAPISSDQNQEFAIDVALSCSACSSDSYLRAVFYPGGTSYFGYTQNNGGNWINVPGSSCTEYYKILTTDLSPEGSWSGKLKVKPDTVSSFYSGPGEYLFKIGRYTPSCSSPKWSAEQTIILTGPTPTSTPSPTNTPTPTSAPAATPVPATATQTPTKAPTKTPAPTPTRAPTPGPTAEASVSGEILGSQVMPSAEEEPRTTDRRPLIFTLLATGIGLALLATALVLQKQDILKRMFKRKEPPAES